MIKIKDFIIVFKFVYLKYIKNKGNIITTLIFVFLLVIANFLPGIINTFKNNRDAGIINEGVVAILDNTGQYSKEVLLTYFPEYEWNHYDSFYNIEEIILSDKYDLAIEITDLNYKMYVLGNNTRHFINNRLEEMIIEVNIAETLVDLGIHRQEVNNLINLNPEGEIITIQDNMQVNLAKAYMILAIFYIFTIFFGQSLSYSIVTEKSTKLIELLITSTKPIYLIFGKVLGIGFANITQMLVLALTTLIMQSFSGNSIISISPGTFIIVSTFLILGFFLYSFIYAIIAVLCNSIEELNSYIIFPTFTLMIVFLISLRGLANLDSGWITIFSYIPIFSPMIMFSKVYLDVASIFEYTISLIILVGAVFIFGYITAKIYKIVVLTRGNSNKLMYFIKALRKHN